MEITVFSKKRQGQDGRSFDSYIGRLHKKDGTELTVGIQFRKECGNPKAELCPMNIIVDKSNANLSTKVIGTNEDTGEAIFGHTLWISKWTEGPKYVDHSLDDFE